MAATSSTMLPLGTSAPDFTLPDVATGVNISLKDFDEKEALLIIFLCAHCPYVIHVQKELASIGRDYTGKSVAIVGITSNDTEEYPEDAPKPTAAFAEAAGISFPILFDASQSVAKAFTAACTPDFFLFDGARRLVYRGQLDASRPKSGSVPDGKDVRAALDALLSKTEITPDQKPSIGCNIKWKAGNNPASFAK